MILLPLHLHVNVPIVKQQYIVLAMVLQMNDFMVPYESVRRRLEETDIMQKEAADYLWRYTLT